jgi:hypothetical protein
MRLHAAAGLFEAIRLLSRRWLPSCIAVQPHGVDAAACKTPVTCLARCYRWQRSDLPGACQSVAERSEWISLCSGPLYRAMRNCGKMCDQAMGALNVLKEQEDARGGLESPNNGPPPLPLERRARRTQRRWVHLLQSLVCFHLWSGGAA